jgi:transcriptional regulator with XRE-family HTH domain
VIDVETARSLESVPSHSPLASVRLRRKLTVEEAAKRAGIDAEEVRWLEQARVYRFPSPDAALIACLLYATALDIDRRDARKLAGLPVTPKPLDVNPHARLVAVAAIAALLSALAVAVTFTHFGLGASEGGSADKAPAKPALPPPWRVQVDVLNGSGDINFTRRVATRIGALGYRIGRVMKASRFDYTHTAVYFEPGGREIAVRLARQIGVVTRPLPGGKNPLRVVVIVGPEKGPG